MATKKQEMSLEEFERQRYGGGTGVVQKWLRGLEPLTPTCYSDEGRSNKTTASGLHTAWRGNGATSTVAIVDEKGGTLRTSTINGALWVVWYPEDQNGS